MAKNYGGILLMSAKIYSEILLMRAKICGEILQKNELLFVFLPKANYQSRIYKGFVVPRPGLEPGWIAPLVFETSASTYSAIWA